MDGSIHSLYIHVPFCLKKCDYCAFYSEVATSQLQDRYVAALIREFSYLGSDLKPETIFVGGGTPTILRERHWTEIFNALKSFDLSELNEFTVECNPITVRKELMDCLLGNGVNRISMGLQSSDNSLLARLGRIHNTDQVLAAYNTLRTSGFKNINLDLMFGIPGQTMEDWRQTMEYAFSLNPEHLSCYEMTYEEDTPLYKELCRGNVVFDQELACDMYELLLDEITSHGFIQYEVSNFARGPMLDAIGNPVMACHHNIAYWRGSSYHGLGPSACDFVCQVRHKNKANILQYCTDIEKGLRPTEYSDALPPEERAGEIAAFGLRMNRGWGFDEFTQTTGFDLRTGWKAEMLQLVDKNYAKMDESTFHLTRQGMRFADGAASLFLRNNS